MARRSAFLASSHLVAALSMVLALVLCPLPASAACATDIPDGASAALVAAIACANSTLSSEVIALAPGGIYTLTAASLTDAATGLPPIADAALAGTLTLNGNGATLQRASAAGTPFFRLIVVSPGGSLTLNQITLAGGDPRAFGGAVYNGGLLTMADSTVEGNIGTIGGGILNNGTVSLTRTVIRQNSALQFGGGLASQGIATLTDSTISDNTAFGAGGLLNGRTMTVSGSTIARNSAVLSGGGITNAEGVLFLANSTISGNQVTGTSVDTSGGGAIVSYGQGSTVAVTLVNSTVTANSAAPSDVQRSGIWIESRAFSVRNSIIAENNGANNCALEPGVVFTDSGGNLDSGTSCGFGASSLSNATANLAALANNGGPTLTHALLPGSQAINGGINANATDQNGTALSTDQRGTGFARINNTTVDSGAYESSVSALDIFLSMQGRSAPKPHSSYAVSVRVTIMPSGGGAAFYDQTIVSSANGTFTIPNLPPGTYLFRFKGAHTLAVQQVLTIGTGSNSLETSVLREGDANNDNVITISDFSLLAAAFGKATGQVGFDARADFNQDGAVTVADFALLAANFGQVGAS